MQIHYLQWNIGSKKRRVLADDAVDVFIQSFSDLGGINDFSSILSADELQRAEKLHASQRYNWQAARYFLKTVLAQYVGGTPKNIVFEKTAHGKPILTGRGIEFSLSHTRRYVALAIAKVPVGIDIEEGDPEVDIYGVGKLCFTADEYKIVTESSRPLQLFYETWVTKEAHIKCLDITLEELNNRSQLSPMQPLIAPSGVYGALAWQATR